MDDNTRTVLVELLKTVKECRREIAFVSGSLLAASSKTEIMVVVNNVISTGSP